MQQQTVGQSPSHNAIEMRSI